MTAWVAVNLGLFGGAAAAVAWALAARAIYLRRLVMPWILGLVAASGLLFGMTAIPVAALWIARVDLPRTPAALLLAVAWGLAGGIALFSWGRTGLRIAPAIVLVTTSCLPTGIVGTAVGAVGGAMKSEKTCMGNLKAVGRAFRDYVAAHHQWPAETRWVDELVRFLPYPKVFRCPAKSMKTYQYFKPLRDDPPDTAVIVCSHPFVEKLVVLRKDFKVEERALADSEDFARAFDRLHKSQALSRN